MATTDDNNEIRLGMSAFGAGNLADAERSFRAVLRKEPKHATALNLLAVVLIRGNRLTEAEAYLRRALVENPKSDTTLYNYGLVLKSLNRPNEALDRYTQALKINPSIAEIWNNRGTVFNDIGRYREAAADFDRAIAINPTYADAHFNRGNALAKLKKFDQSLAAYDRALMLRPELPEAWVACGNILAEINRNDEALTAYDKALTLKPDLAGAWLGRGNVFAAARRPDKATVAFDTALELKPDLAEAWLGRGNVCYELEQYDAAAAAFDKALAINASLGKAWLGRGNVLTARKQFNSALAAYDTALRHCPDLPDAWLGRSKVFAELKQYNSALSACDRALALAPDSAKAWLGRGIIYASLERHHDALAAYDRASTQNPDLAADVLLSRGFSLERLKRFDDALTSYDQALKVRPHYSEVRYNSALNRLLVGDFTRGWEQHEWRWETARLKNGKRNFSQPQWSGTEQLAGKTIVLHAEQGYGDTIQFCRYVPLVADRAQQVILEVQHELHDLMNTLAGSAQIISRGDRLPTFETHCPLLSLPRAFRAELNSIPAETPYLGASDLAAMRWNEALGPKHRPRIGLAWFGNSLHLNDRNRSIELGALLMALKGIDATFISLQRDLRSGDTALLHEQGMLHFGEELTDFSETAGLIANLDLIVSVDTSIAHLAGALARPVWILLPFIPDWRWLLDREDSPWYPTARLFRQDDTREWNNVLVHLRAALSSSMRTL